MSDSLPERPDLGQLRRQARELRDAARRGDAAAVERFGRHHPAALRGVASLASAQLVIARELGFASWPRLKAAIDTAADIDRRVQAFVSAVIDGRLHQARDIFGADPGIARRGLLAATVLGDAEAVREMLAADPTRIDRSTESPRGGATTGAWRPDAGSTRRPEISLGGPRGDVSAPAAPPGPGHRRWQRRRENEGKARSNGWLSGVRSLREMRHIE